MNILLIVLLVVALLICVVKGFIYFTITSLLLQSVFSNDLEAIKKFNPGFYKNRRLLFMARVNGDSVHMIWNPLWILVYPFFYYYGWNILMYSYVYGEKEMSQYLADAGVDMNRKDVYGTDATLLRELDEKGRFKRYKLAAQLKTAEEMVMRGVYQKYSKPRKKGKKKNAV